jgi:hypothetical protein
MSARNLRPVGHPIPDEANQLTDLAQLFERSLGIDNFQLNPSRKTDWDKGGTFLVRAELGKHGDGESYIVGGRIFFDGRNKSGGRSSRMAYVDLDATGNPETFYVSRHGQPRKEELSPDLSRNIKRMLERSLSEHIAAIRETQKKKPGPGITP